MTPCTTVGAGCRTIPSGTGYPCGKVRGAARKSLSGKGSRWIAAKTGRPRGADAEELSALIGRGRPKRGIFEGDLDEGELEIGQIAALIEDLPPAGEILRRLVAEYEAARGSLGPL